METDLQAGRKPSGQGGSTSGQRSVPHCKGSDLNFGVVGYHGNGSGHIAEDGCSQKQKKIR